MFYNRIQIQIQTSFFLRTFNVVDDSLANYDNAKSLQPVSLTEVLSKEEMVRYDLNGNGQIGFQNRELLMPAFSTVSRTR